MRNPKFKKIRPNYRKKALEIVLQEKGKAKSYLLPFIVFGNKKIGLENRFTEIEIDKSLSSLAARFILEDGTRGDFPSDLVLYYCDPSYHWSPLNQIKQAIVGKVKKMSVSLRVMADALHTSPAQVRRLLNDQNLSKQWIQLFHLAGLAGYEIQFQLKKKVV